MATCQKRTVKAILYFVAAVTIIFGIITTFALINNPRQNLLVQLLGILINISTGVLLLVAALKNNRRYVNAFLWIWFVILVLGTIGLIVFLTKYHVEQTSLIVSIAIVVIRWVMQFAVFWAYFKMEKPVVQASFNV